MSTKLDDDAKSSDGGEVRACNKTITTSMTTKLAQQGRCFRRRGTFWTRSIIIQRTAGVDSRSTRNRLGLHCASSRTKTGLLMMIQEGRRVQVFLTTWRRQVLHGTGSSWMRTAGDKDAGW